MLGDVEKGKKLVKLELIRHECYQWRRDAQLSITDLDCFDR